MEENQFTSEESAPQKPILFVPNYVIPDLAETSKWGKFLAIMGFIGTGMMVLFGIFFGSVFSSIAQDLPENPFRGGMGIMMSVIYVLMGLVYFFPSLYLYRFSSKTKTAIIQRNSEQLGSALENQKSLYKFMGIFVIISISLYFLIFIFAFIGGMLGSFL